MNRYNERHLLRAFVAADVRFLVVGAYALALHGRPRATGDLDVWVEATPENAARVMRALEADAWAYRLRRPFGEVEVDFIGRESFIRNKRATGQPKDLGDTCFLSPARATR